MKLTSVIKSLSAARAGPARLPIRCAMFGVLVLMPGCASIGEDINAALSEGLSRFYSPGPKPSPSKTEKIPDVSPVPFEHSCDLCSIPDETEDHPAVPEETAEHPAVPDQTEQDSRTPEQKRLWEHLHRLLVTDDYEGWRRFMFAAALLGSVDTDGLDDSEGAKWRAAMILSLIDNSADAVPVSPEGTERDRSTETDGPQQLSDAKWLLDTFLQGYKSVSKADPPSLEDGAAPFEQIENAEQENSDSDRP